MGKLRTQLDAMVVSVSSSDGNITATLKATDELDVSIEPGTYDRYDERRLGHQLATLSGRLWSEYQRAFDEAFRASISPRAVVLDEPWRANRRRLREERRRIEFVGMSPAEEVYVGCTGMRHWHAVVRAGALRRLTADELLDEYVGAHHALWAYHANTMRELRHKHQNR